MATRSNIGILKKNGKVNSIYVHYDGYPSGVGKTLLDNYKDKDKIDKLIKLGDASILDEEITKPQGHTFDENIRGYSVFYGRDRGDLNAEPFAYNNLADFIEDSNDYVYYYSEEDDKWYWVDNYSDDKEVNDLSQTDFSKYGIGGYLASAGIGAYYGAKNPKSVKKVTNPIDKAISDIGKNLTDKKSYAKGGNIMRKVQVNQEVEDAQKQLDDFIPGLVKVVAEKDADGNGYMIVGYYDDPKYGGSSHSERFDRFYSSNLFLGFFRQRKDYMLASKDDQLAFDGHPAFYGKGDDYAKGGTIDGKIKEWYTKNYPTDELGEEMNDTNTFEDLSNALNKGDDVYDTMGVGDSLIRERLFEHLAKIKGEKYEFIYQKWLGEGMITDEEIRVKYNYAKGGKLTKNTKSKIIHAVDDILDDDITDLDLGARGLSEKLVEKGVIDKSEIDRTTYFIQKEMVSLGYYEEDEYAKGGEVGKTYQIKGADVTFYEDSYEEGEQDQFHSYYLGENDFPYKTKFSNKKDLFETLNDFVSYADMKEEDFYVDEDTIQTSALVKYEKGMYNRLIFSAPTEKEKELWKKGEMKLYSAQFVFPYEVYKKEKLEFAKGGNLSEYELTDGVLEEMKKNGDFEAIDVLESYDIFSQDWNQDKIYKWYHRHRYYDNMDLPYGIKYDIDGNIDVVLADEQDEYTKARDWAIVLNYEKGGKTRNLSEDELWDMVESYEWDKNKFNYEEITKQVNKLPKNKYKQLYGFVLSKFDNLNRKYKKDWLGNPGIEVSDDGWSDLRAEVVGRGKNFYNYITVETLQDMARTNDYQENFKYIFQDHKNWYDYGSSDDMVNYEEVWYE